MMKKFVAAAAIGIAAISPAMIQQKAPVAMVLVADGGRAYSGKEVQSGSRQPSASTSSSSSSSSSSPSSPSQPAPAANPVGAAVKAGSDLLGVFGR